VCFIVRKTISKLKCVILTTLFLPVQKTPTNTLQPITGPDASNLRSPTRHHRCRSSSKRQSIIPMLGFVPSKTPAFQCFQSIQMPKTTTMLRSFLLSFGTFLLAFLHHSAKVCSLLLGIHDWKSSGEC
jgi:hypothetical protein